MVAARRTVDPDLVADPSKLVIYQAGVESGDSTRPNFILDKPTRSSVAFSSKHRHQVLGSAVQEGHCRRSCARSSTCGAKAAANAENLATGQNVVVNSLKERVADDSAVNIDVEMANLLNLKTMPMAPTRGSCRWSKTCSTNVLNMVWIT